MRKASICPFTGRTGGRRSGGSPAMVARPGACGQHHDIGFGARAVFKDEPGGAPVLDADFLDRTLLDDRRAGCRSGDAQRLAQFAVVDLVILRAEHGAGDLAGQMRLLAARRRGRQPFQRQAELERKVEPMRDLGLIVRGQRQHQRALAPQFDIDAACAQKLLGESRPARLAVAAERDQRLFAGFGLRAGRQHPGRRIARAGSGLAAVVHRNLGAAAKPPGDAEPDDAGADNGDARALADRRKWNRSFAQRGSLRWNDPDRFDGFDLSRVAAAPLAEP